MSCRSFNRNYILEYQCLSSLILEIFSTFQGVDDRSGVGNNKGRVNRFPTLYSVYLAQEQEALEQERPSEEQKIFGHGSRSGQMILASGSNVTVLEGDSLLNDSGSLSLLVRRQLVHEEVKLVSPVFRTGQNKKEKDETA